MMRPDSQPGPVLQRHERRETHRSSMAVAPFGYNPQPQQQHSDFADSGFGGGGGGGGNDPPLPSGLEYAKLDGVSHINIYSKGQTALGKALSHFHFSPFVHPHYGPFNSMEGFWYYVKSSVKDDQLRVLTGHKAKEYGKKLPAKRRDNFKEVIIEANFHKIEQNARIKEMMIESVLPFDHYYLFGNGPVFVRPPGFGWLVDGFAAIRAELKLAKQEERPAAWPKPAYD